MASDSVTFRVGSETFQTSYTVFGDLKSGTPPLVVLNGGPGLSHSYMLPHADLHKTHGQPVVLYDQLGTGDSTRLQDRPAGFFTPALFVAELDNLIRHLHIDRDFDLLGQSWGVTLAIEYIAAHRPQGLKHLVLTSGGASYPLWRAALADLRKQWPQDYQDMMNRHEREGTIDAQEYQEGLMRFYRKHILNLEVWPTEATKTLTQMGKDPTVYRAMLGINEFVMTGSLKDWSVIPKLGNVSCPTLIINGINDEVQDSCVAPLFYGIKKAKWVTLGSSSHMGFWEEPEKYFSILKKFLTDSGLGNGAEAQEV
ncbi:proline-specific peptidase [Lactarius psammicola]|nr:proline-specific peptidase [Lactarius psammicola]